MLIFLILAVTLSTGFIWNYFLSQVTSKSNTRVECFRFCSDTQRGFTRAGVIVVVAIVLVVCIGYLIVRLSTSITPAQTPSVVSSGKLLASVMYSCPAKMTITASFYEGESKSTTVAGQMPTPVGSVDLTFSDGRTMKLSQTVSADGARYANKDESIVFWNKGNGVMFTENNDKTPMNCIEVAQDSGGLPQFYASTTQGFSVRYPTGYTVDDTYQYQQFGLGKEISGVKFTISQTMATGTNLGEDSYISVEQKMLAGECTPTPFLDNASTSTLMEGNTTYSIATSTGAGAGNRYEETVYVLTGTSPCIAVRYFIHYGVFDNYPKGMVTEFDKKSVLDQFDLIRRTLTVAQ